MSGKLHLLIASALLCVGADAARASDLSGPARFCGYSPIIDLLAGETVTTLKGGIHSGSFRWEGPFGTLEVTGIGWAGQPPGEIERAGDEARPTRFKPVHEHGSYSVALWNGRNGAAYFHSKRPITAAQSAAIDRVRLYEEGEQPKGCTLRTIFVWE